MDTIKFKAIQNPQTKEIELQVLRPIDDKDWVIIDHFNGMTPQEFRALGDYIYSIFHKKS